MEFTLVPYHESNREVYKMYFKKVLIAIDQLINVLFGGAIDEMLSARAYRMDVYEKSKFWKVIRKFIDSLFFLSKDHCFNCFTIEVRREQLPELYQNNKLYVDSYKSENQ